MTARRPLIGCGTVGGAYAVEKHVCEFEHFLQLHTWFSFLLFVGVSSVGSRW